MRILGIIAEYDPFHLGHARHLRLAREAVRPDYTYAVLSGCFKQRGEPALLSPYDRAACALAAGADAVFALRPGRGVPADEAGRHPPGLRGGDGSSGQPAPPCGTNGASGSGLSGTAEETPGFGMRLSPGAAAGRGGGKTRRRPSAGKTQQYPGHLLSSGHPPPRGGTGARAHSETRRIDAREPSASAIRDSLLRGNYGEAYEAVTGESAQILRKAFLGRRIPDPKCLDALLIQRLRRSTKEDLRRLPDLSEGLEDRLAEAAGAVNTRGELLDAVSTRRYPRARISRICTASLLDMTREQLDREPLPEQAVLLGLRKHPGMTALWREKQDLISREWRHETDLLAWKTWALCTGLPDTLPRSERVIVYPPSGPVSGEDG